MEYRFLSSKWFYLSLLYFLLLASAGFAFPPPEVILATGGMLLKPLLFLIPFLLLPLYYVLARWKLHHYWKRFTSKPIGWSVILIGIVLGVLLAKQFPEKPPLPYDPKIYQEDLPLAFESASYPYPVIIDIRSPNKYNQWHLAGAINLYGIDLAEAYIRKHWDQIKRRGVVLYCYAGGKTGDLIKQLIRETDLSQFDLPYPPFRYIDKGGYEMQLRGKGHHFREVRIVPEVFAHFWIAEKRVSPFYIKPSDLRLDPKLKALNHALSRNSRPTAIFLDSSLNREFIESLIHTTHPLPHFYVTQQDQELVQSTLPFLWLGHQLRKNNDGVWSHVFLIFLIQGTLMFLLRRKDVLSSLNKTRRIWSILFVLVSLSGTLLTAALMETYYDFYARSYAETVSFVEHWDLFFLFIALAITGALWMHLNNPMSQRKQKLVSIFHGAQKAQHIPFVLDKKWNWAILWSLIFTVFSSYGINAPTIYLIIFSLYFSIIIDWSLAKWFHFRFRHCEAPELPPLSQLIQQDLEQHLQQSQSLLKKKKAQWEASQIRFDAIPFEGLMAFSPTPLTLDVLKQRWASKGSATKALRSFGVMIQKTPQPSPHLVVLGSHLYKDLAIEKQIIRGNSLVLRYHLPLFLDIAEDEWVYSIRPAAQRRLKQYQDTLLTPSFQSLSKQTLKGLKTLSTQAAIWQEKVAFAHATLFQWIEAEAQQHSLSLNEVLHHAKSLTQQRALPLVHHYEFYSNRVLPAQAGIQGAQQASYLDPRLRGDDTVKKAITKLPPSLQKLLQYWQLAEHLRQEAQSLYLEEFSAVSHLLTQLGEALGIGRDLVFLNLFELRYACQRRTRKARTAFLESIPLEQRNQHWQRQQRITLPLQLSIENLEGLKVSEEGDWHFEGQAATEDEASQRAEALFHLKGLWVSGGAQSIQGRARLMDVEAAIPEDLNTQSIAVMPRLDPHQVMAFKGIGGIIAEQGSMLSHAAILVREMGIPTLFGVHRATERLQEGDLICMEKDASVTKSKPLPLWLPLEDTAQEFRVGNKAHRLGVLLQKQLPVPRGAVLTAEALTLACHYWNVPLPTPQQSPTSLPEGLVKRDFPPQLLEELSSLMNRLGLSAHGWIVRSSANVEDQSAHSFAGVFRSESGVHHQEDLIEKIAECWSVLWEVDFKAYMAPGQLSEVIQMNLLIQEFIPAEWGGVLFTQDPSNPQKPQYLLEMAKGGAKAVVDGTGDIIRWTLSPEGQLLEQAPSPSTQEASELSSEAIQTLCHYAQQLQQHFNAPQDIEWVLSPEGIKLLQSRDITVS